MATSSQRFALNRSGSQKSVDPKPSAGPSLASQKSGLLKAAGSGSAAKITLGNELLEASEHYSRELAEFSTDSNCFHCKDSPVSGDANCHICGHTACARCSKPCHISERFRRKKDDPLLRVCFACKHMLLNKDKPNEGKKEIAPPIWEVKDSYANCFECHAAFSKGHQHNCRACGKLFCSSCTTKRTDVPSYFDRKAKTGGLRVCDKCRFAIVGGAVFTDNHQKVREGIESSTVGNVECLPLQLVLSVPQYSSALRDFLAHNHALENVNFLSCVDIYRAIGKQDPTLLLPLARQIYEEFLIPTANQLVNVNATTRDSIEKAVVENQIKVGLFDAAVTAVIAMVEKDVYRRFATTQESKNLMRESDATTFNHYLSSRNRRMSFSILQRKEDTAFLEAVMAALSFQKLLKTVRKGLAWHNDSIEGSHLVAYLHKERYATSRPGAISIAQRLVEGGYISHTLDPTLDFADSDVPGNIYQAIDAVALAKKFPPISSLFKVRENVFGYLLYRGISYCRLWGAVSVEHMKLFLWRKEDGVHAHSALSLKGASVVFETGGEEDEDDAGGFAGGVKDSLSGKDAKLRHGQVYMRITVTREKAVLAHVPEASPSPELVYLLEEPSLRSRWKKCFEKDCKIPVKMVYTAGVSKRAAFVASSPTVAKKESKETETKTSSDSFKKLASAASKGASDSFKQKLPDAPSAPSSPRNGSPNDRHVVPLTPKGLSPPPAEEDAPPPPPRSSPSRPPTHRVLATPPPPLLDAPPPPPPSSPAPPPPAYTPPPPSATPDPPSATPEPPSATPHQFASESEPRLPLPESSQSETLPLERSGEKPARPPRSKPTAS